MAKKSTAIVGYGVVGAAYRKMFSDAIIYDPPKGLFGTKVDENGQGYGLEESEKSLKLGQDRVNSCDVAIVAVWTGLNDKGELDTSIVEEVVGWIECPLILIKSALQPGTVDRLVKKTGKKIAVSVEYIGEGTYPIHFWKYPHQNDPRLHQMLVVGGEEGPAEEAAQFLWRRMSPDVKIHKVTALEAEIVKLIENSQGAMKVVFANTFLSLAQKSNTSFVRMHQAWNSDPRTESMHLRAVEFERGYVSRCWSKDLVALVTYARSIGATDTEKLFQTIFDLNQYHLSLNEE